MRLDYGRSMRLDYGTVATLIGRHESYPITHEAAERWFHHMQQTLDSTTCIDDDSKTRMFHFLSLCKDAESNDSHLRCCLMMQMDHVLQMGTVLKALHILPATPLCGAMLFDDPICCGSE